MWKFRGWTAVKLELHTEFTGQGKEWDDSQRTPGSRRRQPSVRGSAASAESTAHSLERLRLASCVSPTFSTARGQSPLGPTISTATPASVEWTLPEADRRDATEAWSRDRDADGVVAVSGDGDRLVACGLDRGHEAR